MVATTEHYFTVRGRGFDAYDWRTILTVVREIVEKAKGDGVPISLSADATCLTVSFEGEGEDLTIWRKGEPGIPQYVVVTDPKFDPVVQSVLTGVKKVAPDIFEMTSPDARDYHRIYASGRVTPMTNEELIRKAAIRVASKTQNKELKRELLEILRTADEDKDKEARFEEGKSVDVGDWLRENGYADAAKKWEKHEGEIGKSAAVVFPDLRTEAWQQILRFAARCPESKLAKGSPAQRSAAANKLAEKWIQDAIQRPGRVREYLGVPEGETIPMGKLDAAIAKVRATGDTSLLHALQMAKTLKTKVGAKDEEVEFSRAQLAKIKKIYAAIEEGMQASKHVAKWSPSEDLDRVRHHRKHDMAVTPSELKYEVSFAKDWARRLTKASKDKDVTAAQRKKIVAAVKAAEQLAKKAF